MKYQLRNLCMLVPGAVLALGCVTQQPIDAVREWYDTEGPFAGSFAMADEHCSTWVDVSGADEQLDVAYAFCAVDDCSTWLGIDDRRFTLRSAGGGYEILEMGDTRSGQCSVGQTTGEVEDALLGSTWLWPDFDSRWTFTPIVMGNMTLTIDGITEIPAWISGAPWPGWTLDETFDTYLVIQSEGAEPFTYGVEIGEGTLTLHHDSGLGVYRADSFIAE